MIFKNCCCCCGSASDAESVSNKSWTAGAVNKSFDAVETTQPKVTTTTTSMEESNTPTNNAGAHNNSDTTTNAATPRTSIDSEDNMCVIDLNLNIFENDRFTDMAETIHKSQMSLNEL